MDKESVVYKYNSALKEKEILPYVTTEMNLEVFMLREISQSLTGKYYMIPLIGDT